MRLLIKEPILRGICYEVESGAIHMFELDDSLRLQQRRKQK